MIVETQEQLKVIISTEKEKMKSVLIKKGVFDIIHPGHIYAINEFKKKADIVVIFIQSDELTKLKKGDKRPINGQEQRALVANGIKGVDYVFLDKSISRDEYIETLKDLQPSILAITSTDDEKTKEYSGHGWQLVEFSEKKIPGFSTTDIIDEVRKKYTN